MNAYDFTIIGGGPTGYAAAMYAGRLSLKTALFTGSKPGGLIVTTDIVENYPGFKKISGIDIFNKMKEHAHDYDIDEFGENVIELSKDGDLFTIKSKKQEIQSKTILIATGAEYRKLPIPGSDEFENKGVHYCALCDGFAYKEKIVAVIGGSDSAAKEALELSQNAKKVYMIYRGDTIHPEPINGKRVEANEKIEIIYNTNLTEIKGDQMVDKIVLDKEYNGSTEFSVDGIFVAIGHLPQSALAETIGVKVNKGKQILIDRAAQTNVKGCFAAGDVTDTEFKQMITGCAEGVFAAYKAFELLQ